MEVFLNCLVREDLVNVRGRPLGEGSSTVLALSWVLDTGGAIMVPAARTFALGRHKLNDFPYVALSRGAYKIEAPHRLVQILEEAEFPDHIEGSWLELREDFLRSSANAFFSEIQRECVGRRTPCHKAPRELSESGEQAHIRLEQRCIRGHRLHPTPRTPIGQDLAEQALYSPEGIGEFSVALAAIPRKVATFQPIEAGIDPHCWLTSAQHQDCVAKLNALGRDASQFYIVPIHPIQLALYLRPHAALLEDGGQVVLLREDGPLVQPLISARTLYLPSSNLYAKVPLHVTITSAMRTLSIRPRHNSIVLARIFDQIKRTDNALRDFAFQREIMSVGLLEGEPHFKDLGMIVREPCDHHFDGQTELAITAACLFESSSRAPENAVIDELVAQFLRGGHSRSVRDFFKLYASRLIPPVMRLLSKYGIGLEAHLQNSILVFRDGVPVRAIYRDNDAISVCMCRLSRFEGLTRDFYPESWNIKEDAFSAQDKVRHSLLHSHIAELINHLCLYFGESESELWVVVRQMIEATFDGLLATHEATASDVRDDRLLFFAENTQVKALTRMKLKHQKNDYIYASISNPLWSGHDQ